MNKAIDSAEGSIKFLSATCKKNVREDIRCNLVKTYSRSKLYHGLGIYATWASISSLTTLEKGICVEILTRLEKYQSLERKYMFGFDTYGKDVINSMANLPNIKQLLQSSKSSLSLRLLQNTDRQSPVYSIRTSKLFTSPSVHVKSSLLYTCLNDKLAKDSMYNQETAYPSTYLKHSRITDCHQENLYHSSLVSYISFHCRNKGKMDKLLSYEDSSIRRMMIQWRINKFSTMNSALSCVCGESNLQRTHFDKCQKFIELSPISTYTWKRFHLHKAHRRKKRLESLINDPSHKFPHTDKITIFDYLINIGYYKLFGSVFSLLKFRQAFMTHDTLD